MGEMVENKRITYEVRSLRSLPPYLSRSACIIRAILEDQISKLFARRASPRPRIDIGCEKVPYELMLQCIQLIWAMGKVKFPHGASQGVNMVMLCLATFWVSLGILWFPRTRPSSLLFASSLTLVSLLLVSRSSPHSR